MIVDAHTHIFPPDVIANRDRYLAADATFAELYKAPKAKLASGEDLLASMDAGAIDVSIALGFAWSDVEACSRHNDYLLEVASKSAGRIVAFCTLPLAADIDAIEREARRCADAGARGFGELRPENLGFDLAGAPGKRLGMLAADLEIPLLFHASEPVGHVYAGKRGLRLDALYEFVIEHPDTCVIGAHWGGGLPLYALMPEVKLAFHNAYVDTAATSLLYDPAIYNLAVETLGPRHILFGSDFPLLSQARSRARIEQSGLAAEAVELILGANASRLLDLE